MSFSYLVFKALFCFKKLLTCSTLSLFCSPCLNYKTENKCENLILPSPITGINYKMHSILTYKMENNRLGCINRDKNGCYNIKKLFDTYMTLGNRPERYRRGVKID